MFQGDASVEKVTQEVLENSCHCGKKVATAKGLKIHQTKMKCLQKNQRHIDKEESLTETITGAKLVRRILSKAFPHFIGSVANKSTNNEVQLFLDISPFKY